ncbi:glycoside hydrolase family 27 protein [Nocardia sp. CA2R105]|uniref:glycoside hydrolase family 27 protein n=1 Tax=Nocardia coffeae TaxID=2873381 RepID=UPI001CA6484B|nr:glycoside hydrolase family 27 protein [Nocardia coffeae]MBY8861276.1 glycoside hydrolase family 27 protein [Nocardia coffeae]
MRIRHWVAAVFAATAVLGVAPVQAANAEPASSGPPMGWNSWNSGIPLTEVDIRATIDALVSSGMRDAGYRYVNLDAGWAAAARDAAGDLVADPQRFPSGIAALARYAHDRGMLLGLYSSPYNETCGQSLQNASAGHENRDARAFAAWGVDFLKYDWCRNDDDLTAQVRVFTAMRDALRATGRHIVYSINPNSSAGLHAAQDYDWSRIGDLTRNAHDLYPFWHNRTPVVAVNDFSSEQFLGITDQLAAATPVAPRSRPGYWNDPDMLVVGTQLAEFLGMHPGTVPSAVLKALPLTLQQRISARAGVKQATSLLTLTPEQIAALRDPQYSLTTEEQRTHFSLWAMLAAPLIAGNDVRAMTEQTRVMLTNREVIAVDQDPASVQGTFLPADDHVMVKPLSDGSVAVALYNPDRSPADISTTATAAGLPGAQCYTVRDLWAHTSTTTTRAISHVGVAPHGLVLLRLTPRCG